MFYNIFSNIGQIWTIQKLVYNINFANNFKGVRRKPNRVATKQNNMKKIYNLILTALLLLCASPALATNDTNSCPPPKGIKMVDLGLSVKWADRNVGATSVDDYGQMFMWSSCNSNLDNEATIHFVAPNKNTAPANICGTKFDAARMKWGAPWRLPSKKELRELVNQCKWEWTEKGNTEGWLVTGPNGNSIYLPAAGWKSNGSIQDRGQGACYWSGTAVAPKDDNAYYLSARERECSHS